MSKSNKNNWYGWLPLLPVLLIVWAAVEAKDKNAKPRKDGRFWRVFRGILIAVALVGIGFYFGTH